MKNILVGILLIVLLAASVSAVKDITPSSSALEIIEKPSRTFSRAVSVQNTGNESLSLDISLNVGQLSGFNVKLTPAVLTLNVGETKSFTVNGTIPDNTDTERRNNDIKGNSFAGTINILSGTTTLETIGLTVIAESQLDLDNVKAKVDGDSSSLDPGDNIKDVKPGNKVEFSGDIENLFTDNDDIQIENVEITITIKGIDDSDDLEESDDVGDIDADDKESFSVEFDIPEEVDEDDYNVLIEVEGEDENGATHRVEWELTLELNKEKHDIQVKRATVSPSTVKCSRDISLNIELKNQGENDEDEVVLRIESAALDIGLEDTSIPEIEEGTDSDTEYDKTYTFTIDDDARAATYQILVKSYYDTDTLSDTETIPLVVENCVEQAPTKEEETPTGDVVVVNPPADEEEEEPEIITEPIDETEETASFLQSDTYFIVLVGGIVLALVIIIVMIAVVFSMKRRP